MAGLAVLLATFLASISPLAQEGTEPVPEKEIGVWKCVLRQFGACPPDGLGRAPDAFWTYPGISQSRKISLTNCRMTNNPRWHEMCLGTYKGLAGDWQILRNDFMAELVCPDGYEPRMGQCVEINPPRSDRKCPVPEGSPVDAATGENRLAASDLQAGFAAGASSRALTEASSGPQLELTRTYSSQPVSLISTGRTRLGVGWRSSFDGEASWSGELSKAKLIHLVLPDFSEYSFAFLKGVWKPVWPRTLKGNVYWDRPRADTQATITLTGTAIILRLDDGTRYTFNDAKKLSQIAFADGYTQTLTYTDGLNTRVTDSKGRWLNLVHGPAGSAWAGLLVVAQGSGGAITRYSYEDRAQAGRTPKNPSTNGTNQWALKSVTYPDSTPSITDNPRTDYEYLDNMYRPYLVTKVTNKPSALPSAWNTTTWTYDVKKRVTSVESTGGKSRWEYYYDDAKQQVTVTDPLQKRYIYVRQTSIEGLASLVLLRPSITSLPRFGMLPPPAARSPIEDLLCKLLGKCSCPVDEKERCSAVKEVCLELCDMAIDNKALPDLQSTYFRRCVNQCLYDLACDNGNNYPDGWDQGKIGTPRPWLGSEGLLNAKGTR